MGYHNHFFKAVRFCLSLTILILAVDVFAFEPIGEDMFLFLSSHYVPPPPCPPNEIYKNCLSNCSDCEHRGICDFDGCKHKGCDCVVNFARLTPGGPCEHVHNCPVPECGENEVFRECGPVCERCGTMRCRILQCDHKCYCKEGYLREWEGKCVPEAECPPKLRCSRDEQKADSGRVDEYCLHADDEEVSNATETKERCYCKEGLRRNAMGHCSHENLCEYVKCLNEEKYQLCPRKCNTTCRNYGNPTCEEDGQCYPGCFCPEGYLMNDIRRCVLPENCPPGSNPFAPTAGPTTTPAMTESTSPVSTPVTQTVESDTSSSTPIPTTAQTPESTLVDETTESSADETTKSSVDVDTKTSVPVTSTAEATKQSSAEEEDEEEEEPIEETQTTPKPTTQKPKSQKGRRNEKEKKLTTKEKKATTPTEEDMDEDNE